MAVFLYNIVIWIYFGLIKLAGPFNRKARLWINGRTGIFEKLSAEFAFQKINKEKIVWMHCASLGEFEQGRPLIETIKKDRPSHKILLTFFSPSGFEIRKNYGLADWIYYLPPDNANNACRFIKIVKPTLVIFVKYEFWYHYLTQLKANEIPLFLIAATFRKDQPFFKWYGSLYREMLECFNEIFVQDDPSKTLLTNLGLSNLKLAGDTRVDGVIKIAKEKRDFPKIRSFCESSKIMVCGSTWRPDEKIVSQILRFPEFGQWKIIIAPHDISLNRIKEVENLFGNNSVRYSDLIQKDKKANNSLRVLIMDNIGMLSSLYQYGHIAYIGGGFGKSIHSTLEPMAFNLPVMYGPRYEKFSEALIMVGKGGHLPIKSSEQFLLALKKLSDIPVYQAAQKAIADFMNEKKGATKIIMDVLSNYM